MLTKAGIQFHFFNSLFTVEVPFENSDNVVVFYFNEDGRLEGFAGNDENGNLL